MTQDDPIVRLYRKGALATLLGFALVAGIIGSMAILPFYQNLRTQGLEQFQRQSRAVADQLPSS